MPAMCLSEGQSFGLGVLYIQTRHEINRVEYSLVMTRVTEKARQRRKEVERTTHVEDEKEWEWDDGIEDVEPSQLKKRFVEHTAIHHGRQVYRVGDVVQVEGGRVRKWVALIRQLITDFTYPEGERKRAIVIWFIGQEDIKDIRRRKDATDVSPWKK